MTEVHICREGQNNSNIIPRYYMNVGSWGDNGRTDFAVICGNALILATWLPMSPGQPQFPRRQDKEALERNSTLKTFFQKAAAVGDGRGFVRTFELENGEDLFTEASKMIIVIGDCHINLLKEWGPDSFIRQPISTESDQFKTRISMWKPFKEFVDFAANQVSKDRLIQVGDLFDTWEAQNIFEHAAYTLLQLMLRFSPTSVYGVASEQGRTYSIRKDLPSRLLSKPTKYDLAKQATFKVGGTVREGLDSKKKLALYLARYFDIPDPDYSAVPKYKATSAYAERHGYDSKFLDLSSPHFTEHQAWCRQAQKNFYASKPTLRDALTLIFCGLNSGWHGMANHTPPIEFDKTTRFYQFDTGWNSSTIDHFKKQCDALVQVDQPCDFLNCNQVNDLIAAQYDPATFKKLHRVVGNHDIGDRDEGGKYANQYLKLMFVDGLSFSETMKKLDATSPSVHQINRLDETCKLDDPYLSYLCGKDDGIVIEHGHVWDPYNNPVNYYLFNVNASDPLSSESISLPQTDDEIDMEQLGWRDLALPGGYHSCRGWTVGESFTSSPLYDGDMNDPTYFTHGYRDPLLNVGKVTYSHGEAGKQLVMPQADFELALSCEERMNGIFLNAVHGQKPRRLRLVVMGHTHVGYIIKWTNWLANRPDRSPLGTSISGLGAIGPRETPSVE